MLNKFKNNAGSEAMKMLKDLADFTEGLEYPGCPYGLLIILDAGTKCATINGEQFIGADAIMRRLGEDAIRNVIAQPFVRVGNWVASGSVKKNLDEYENADAEDFEIGDYEMAKAIYAVWGMLSGGDPDAVYWIQYDGESGMMGAKGWKKTDLDAIHKFMNESKWGDENKDFYEDEENYPTMEVCDQAMDTVSTRMCSSCPKAQQCNEECDTCDEYEAAVHKEIKKIQGGK